ncbi:MAG: 16S rRNA (cytosine1402-N4)-methyltransferase [Sphingobacteriales bacterium]|jgi:16S rRNA (cytosine1402-N4)-methyltransferase
MLTECIEGLDIKPNGTYVDVTFGGGGHSQEILNALNEKGKLFGFDQDAEAVENALEDNRFKLVEGNFRHLKRYLKFYKGTPVDGILADLGVSSHQFDEGVRGFSTRFDGRLDMRMNQDSALSAFDVVNTYAERELMLILRLYGEVPRPHLVAKAIVNARLGKEIETTEELKSHLLSLAPKFKENKFFAMVFQAIRIEVNDELTALKEMLLQAIEILKPGGRLVVMSYHSLEDRLVKNLFNKGKFDGEIEKDFFGNHLNALKVITRKPVSPTDEECERNNRARSAKLRIAEKI